MAEDERDERNTQRNHWRATFVGNPDMYGTAISAPASAATELFASCKFAEILELGAGQGRDTLAFLKFGFWVTALDYSEEGIAAIVAKADSEGLNERLTATVHDVRQALPLEDSSVDAVFSHMLFNMALTTSELIELTAETLRVLRPGGYLVYTVRHVGDAHFGQGRSHGDGMWENGGFIVHFFDKEIVDRLAAGFSEPEIEAFEEGELPRKLWRVTQRKLDTLSPT